MPRWDLALGRSWLAVVFVLSSVTAGRAAEGAVSVTLSGRVVDALSGQPLVDARVSIEGQGATLTDSAGRFTLAAVRPDATEVCVERPGYRRAQAPIVPTRAAAELEIRLNPAPMARSEEVAVTARADSGEPGGPTARRLDAGDVEKLANVLVDDPLRSAQSLPGVASSDDFGATFAARGQGFANIGFYIDGVLMTAPFHTVRDVNDAFSLTVLNGEAVDSLVLVTGGAPARYGDRTGSVLAVTTREGSRKRLRGGAGLGLASMDARLEGPLGAAATTSWLVATRKSYLGYVLQRLDEGAMALGFSDTIAKVSHHRGGGLAFSASVLHGRSRWTNTRKDLEPQDARSADAGTDLATLRGRWMPSGRSWIDVTAFVSRETGRDTNLDGTERFGSASRQWGLRADGAQAAGSHLLEAGVLVRNLSEEARTRVYQRTVRSYRLAGGDAASTALGLYAQDSWRTFRGRLRLTAGGRLDRFGETAEAHVAPRGALDWRVSGTTRVLAAFGRYAQFPDFQQLFGPGGNPDLRAQSATHLAVGVERALGSAATIRVDGYDQRLAGFISNPEAGWKLMGGRVVGADSDAPLRNGIAGRSRGAEVTVERRSGGALSGWVAYTFGRARWREGDGPWFDGDFDQRHTVTVFGVWRVRPTVTLSTKYRYGSGFPVAGYFEPRAGGVFLSAERNAYRPDVYSRWDLRVGKTFAAKGWTLAAYAEVLNVLDRRQTRHGDMDRLDVQTGRVVLGSDRLFPRLPSVGVSVEF